MASVQAADAFQERQAQAAAARSERHTGYRGAPQAEASHQESQYCSSLQVRLPLSVIAKPYFSCRASLEHVAAAGCG